MADFFLRTKRTEGMASLYTRVKKRNPEIKWEYVNTGITVDIEAWTKAKKSIVSWSKYIREEGKEVNEKLDKVAQTIELLFKEGRIKSNDDKAILENELSLIANNDALKVREEVAERQRKQREFEKKERIRQQKQILNFYQYFLDGIADKSIRHGNNTVYREDSVRVWKDFGKHLRAFCPKDMTFDDITKPFADKFSLYLEKQGYMANTVNKYMVRFRKLCNIAAEEGINNNAVSLKVWKERAVHDDAKRAEVYLTTEELDALYEMELEGKEEQIRDLFLIGVFCAQRISDFSRLTRKNFKVTSNGTPVICLSQQKTGTYVEVPYMDERVDEIGEKYNYMFPSISKRDMNRYLKDILKKLSETVPSLMELYPTALSRAEIRKEQLYQEMCKKEAKGEKFDAEKNKYFKKMKAYAEEHNGSPLYMRDEDGNVLMYKYELIVSHTARRSALTNLYKTGMFDNREMMAISGHKSERVFEKYIKVGVSEQADRIYNKLKVLKGGKNKKVG